MNKMNVFYTGAFRFPDQDAAGKRVAQMVNVLESVDECGNIIVGGWEQGNKHERDHSDKCTAFSFSLLDKLHTSFLSRFSSHLFMGMSVLKWLVVNRHRYAIIILYNPPFLFSLLTLFLSLFLKKSVSLDSTEWYESAHLKGGKYGLVAIENWLRMKVAYPLFNNHIVISSFLEKYFYGYSKNIVRIPPLASQFVSKKAFGSNLDKKISFFYAGNIGNKDKLEVFIRQLAQSPYARSKVHFHIAGTTEEDFLRKFSELSILKAEICEVCTFLGRIPMHEVYERYEHVDYCVFFREKKRYALAGFPSKFVESLSFDTPVITNAVGDITAYFPDVGFLYEPGTDDIELLVDKLVLAKDSVNQNIERIFLDNFSIQSQTQKLQVFIKRLK
ncbi:glycosyltransferase [Enterobacter asburiae]|nr:glycosyltransferase [Enterobacter asburiae]